MGCWSRNIALSICVIYTVVSLCDVFECYAMKLSSLGAVLLFSVLSVS